MNVYVNQIDGIPDAVVSMYMSKRTWTRQKEMRIRELFYQACEWALDEDDTAEINKYLDTLVKIGSKHITLLRFIDISVTVEGLHRGAQDDLDSHAMRLNNRIVRSSTRLAKFSPGERSSYYKNTIIPTDEALKILGFEKPETLNIGDETYISTANGYILKSEADNQDVQRGLYMLSIPSNFIFKVNLAEWAHIYKMRNKDSTANPELKECVELIQDQIERFEPRFNRDLMLKIPN